MKKCSLRFALVSVLLLGLAMPAVASAGWFNWGCRYQGTWFGVQGPESPTPEAFAGWMVTIEGKSYWYGTNNVEFTAASYDPRLPDPFNPGEFLFDGEFEHAVATSTNRGNWVRTGYNTFAYTMTGFAMDANRLPVYVAQASGHVTMSEDCNRIEVTAMVSIFPVTYDPFPKIPNPFIDTPKYVIPFPTQYGYRAFVNMP